MQAAVSRVSAVSQSQFMAALHSGEGRSIESGWLKVWRSADSESFLDVYSRPGEPLFTPFNAVLDILEKGLWTLSTTLL